jgi:hypothetical protein
VPNVILTCHPDLRSGVETKIYGPLLSYSITGYSNRPNKAYLLKNSPLHADTWAYKSFGTHPSLTHHPYTPQQTLTSSSRCVQLLHCSVRLPSSSLPLEQRQQHLRALLPLRFHRAVCISAHLSRLNAAYTGLSRSVPPRELSSRRFHVNPVVSTLILTDLANFYSQCIALRVLL